MESRCSQRDVRRLASRVATSKSRELSQPASGRCVLWASITVGGGVPRRIAAPTPRRPLNRRHSPMSYNWPPQQEPPPQHEPPSQAGWPQSWYPPQPPSYDRPGYGYGPRSGYGSGYGAPGPSSAGRPSGWPPPQPGDPWSQWGRGTPQEMYQPGRPAP